MIRRSGFVAIASLVSLALVSCEQPTEIALAPIRADVTAAALTYFASRSDFLTQFHGLALETFEAGRVPDADTQGCPGPLNATSNNVCFHPGEIQPGIQFNSDHASGQDETGQDVALLGTGFGPGTSKQLVATFDVDALLIDFYEHLVPLGYQVGKLHRDHVEFRPYRFNDENFFGPNYVAVHSSRADVIGHLSEPQGRPVAFPSRGGRAWTQSSSGPIV